MEWAAGFIVPGIAGVGVWVTAHYAYRAKKEEIKAPDWSGYAARLESRIDGQDRKINELFDQVGSLRSELEAEQRLSSIVIRYLRTVLAWALERLPAGTPIPPPPSEISAELGDYIGGGLQ